MQGITTYDYMNHTNKRGVSIFIFLLLGAADVLAQEENMKTIADHHHLAAYLVAGMLIAIFIMTFINRLYWYKEKEIGTKTKQLNTQLALVLNANKTHIWTYDTRDQSFAMINSQENKRTEYTAIDFSMLYNHDDFSQLMQLIQRISNQEQESGAMIVKSKRLDNEKTAKKIFNINVSVLEKEPHGQPKTLLGIQRDITEDKLRVEKSSNLALRYHTVFNSSLVDMLYYDADGVMTDINEKACDTFEVKDREQLLALKPNIKDIPAMKGIDFKEIESLHSSSITEIEEIDKPIGGLEGRNWGNRKTYYEQVMSPVRKENGELAGIVMAGRNITEMVESQHHQKWASKQLEKKTKDIQNYIKNINYSLRVSNVRLINYYPDKHVMEISNDLNQSQYSLEQLRCITLIHDTDRKRAKGLFRRMDRKHQGPFNCTIHTIFRDHQGRDIYLTFNVIPVSGKDGNITHYLGMCQDNTEMVYTEMKLMKETEKAQETEELKSTFLTNMSYEIRTPLNAVIGFAELYNSPHDEADENVFAEEIKHNTGKLLQLVNDILFISRLDAKMVEFNYRESDFAAIFDSYCYLGWSNVNPGVKVTVENPYNHLLVNIDEQQIGTVIQKLCVNAARQTTEGSIRAKYEYRHGDLSISFEDTGKGFNEEMQKHIFDRFARNEASNHHGTGLDLPIIQELIQQMGGTIEIQSEEGKGSTYYVTIPCELISMEKKSEIIV